MIGRRTFLRVGMVLAASGLFDIPWPAPRVTPEEHFGRIIDDILKDPAVLQSMLDASAVDAAFMARLKPVASDVQGRSFVFPLSLKT